MNLKKKKVLNNEVSREDLGDISFSTEGSETDFSDYFEKSANQAQMLSWKDEVKKLKSLNLQTREEVFSEIINLVLLRIGTDSRKSEEELEQIKRVVELTLFDDPEINKIIAQEFQL